MFIFYAVFVVTLKTFHAVFVSAVPCQDPFRIFFQCADKRRGCGRQVKFKPSRGYDLRNLFYERSTDADSLIIRQDNQPMHPLFSLFHREVNYPCMTYHFAIDHADELFCRLV